MRWWRLKKRNADLERELASDLELEEEEQRERGLSPEEARYAARRAFGNVTLIREQTREAWGWAMFERLWQDVRYALRQMRRSRFVNGWRFDLYCIDNEWPRFSRRVRSHCHSGIAAAERSCLRGDCTTGD